MPDYVKVENGVVVEEELPDSGTITVDGTEREVSNYNLLDDATLKAEGWLPLDLDTKRPPQAEGKNVFPEGYEVLKTKVNRTYRVEDIPGPPPPIDVTAKLTNDPDYAAMTEEQKTQTRTVLRATLRAAGHDVI